MPELPSWEEMRSSLSLVENTHSAQQPNAPAKIGSSTSRSENQPSADATAAASSVDFIGSSHAVKDLFSLPYSADRAISVAVHNLDGTLLLDADHQEEERTFAMPRRTRVNDRDELEPKEPEPLGQGEVSRKLVALSSLEPISEALTIVHSMIESTRISTDEEYVQDNDTVRYGAQPRDGDNVLDLPHPHEYVQPYLPPLPEPREYLSWRFHDMNLLVGSDALIYRSSDQSTALTVRVEDAKDMQSLLERHQDAVQSGHYVADHQLAQLQQIRKPTYAEAAAKQRHALEEAKDGGESMAAVRDESHHRHFAAPDLDQVQLQTCIVPSPQMPIGGLLSTSSPEGSNLQKAIDPSPNPPRSSSPVSTVLDVYLDNIMANVPQLALCLRDKGFIQSVKLLRTEDIPAGFLQQSTMDTSVPFSVESADSLSTDEQIFSPEIMEMNASTLLRFLKANCSKDNATYLLRREAGQTNIQLYDVSSISAQRQRKWIWWLAMMSYRFANRLRHISMSTADSSLRRKFRTRQRGLLQNTLDLLENLADMDGSAHESLSAAIRESMADTFLDAEEEHCHDAEGTDSTCTPATTPSISSQQPYGSLKADALGKAQDHLASAIKTLLPLLGRNVNKKHKSMDTCNSHVKDMSIGADEAEDSCDEDDGIEGHESHSIQIDALATQLFGIHHKMVNVSLRLVEVYLRNYHSSSAMQALRLAARKLASSIYLTELVERQNKADQRLGLWRKRILLQYTWLWEHCGHFARSFAADGLWRDRGHSSGDDVIGVLQDVEEAFRDPKIRKSDPLGLDKDPIGVKSDGMVNLQALTGVVNFQSMSAKCLSADALQATNALLERQKVLQRDQRRVLVAACIAYHRASQAFEILIARPDENGNKPSFFHHGLLKLLHQRLGDACNETGKVLLDELRTLLSSFPNGQAPDDEAATPAEPLLFSAEFWFLESLEAFEKCRDLRNLALLRCNLCQCYKLRANSIFATRGGSTKDGPTHPELCLQEAADHLQAAHESLGERDVDPICWDMVSNELAATFLVLGVRRRQSLIGSGNVPLILQALRLSPGKERSIVDPMERALSIYETSGNRHQAAAAHYQLALFYAKIWTCQRDETKTRAKLSSAFGHYNAAHAFFAQAVRGNEATFGLLCMDLSNLYAAVAGEECLVHALSRCLDTAVAFAPETIESALLVDGTNSTTRAGWLEQMETLASSVEERVFKLLRNLIKLPDLAKSMRYKDWYRIGLTAKMTKATDTKAPSLTGDELLDRSVNHLLDVHRILQAVRKATEPPSVE